MENATKQTAVDFEDKSNQELAAVSLATNETQDDRDKNQKSLNRCLDRHLMLVTKVQLGTEWKWLLPFARNTETESLRQVLNYPSVHFECVTDAHFPTRRQLSVH